MDRCQTNASAREFGGAVKPLEGNEQTVPVGGSKPCTVVAYPEPPAIRALYGLDSDVGLGAFGGELPSVF